MCSYLFHLTFHGFPGDLYLRVTHEFTKLAGLLLSFRLVR